MGKYSRILVTRRSAARRSVALSALLSLSLLHFSSLSSLSAPSAAAEEISPNKLRFDLAECYRRAIAQSEQLKIRGTDIEIAEAQYRQALAAVYPEINLQLDQRVRDNSNFGQLDGSRVELDEIENGGVSQRGRTLGETQLDGGVVFVQPIFNGFRDFLLAEAAQKNIEVSRLNRDRVRELLYADVAELYYQILAFQELLKVLARTEETLKNRIGELQEYISLGKSRESEVIAATSELADNEALRARTIGFRDASLELLAFLVGIPSEGFTLAPQLSIPAGKGSDKSSGSQPLQIAAIDAYLNRAKERLDIKAAEITIDAQEVQVKATARQQWPDVSLRGNVYGLEDPDRNRAWELLFQVTVPIFEGGRIRSETAEERARLLSYRYSHDELVRQTERDIRVNYSTVRSLLGELESLRKLKSASEKTYQSQRADYQLGLVTNLDVLTAIQQVQNAERRLIESDSSLRVALAKLEVAAGGIAP